MVKVVEVRVAMGTRKRVLVVEDHPGLRGVLIEELEGLGLEVIGVADGRSAVSALGHERPDLVCLDVVLPEGSGYRVCQYIREQAGLSDVPVLMMSGRNLPVEEAYAHESGANAFLPKPFTREQFHNRVNALLQPNPFAASVGAGSA